jgi:hypothetical protein
VVALAVNFVGNLVVALARGVRPLRQHLTMVLVSAGSGAFFPVPLIIALAYGYDQASLVVLLFSLIPLLAANAPSASTATRPPWPSGSPRTTWRSRSR